ncbi:glutamate synthase-related protein [Salinimonas marina]|uniref:glutamate synthase-related protein n=1 Tax=Salinimonas marina TaxID=2785918 RepID=UPI0038CDBA8E
MMLALGCVQSLSCNTNTCPSGVATQNPKLSKGLDPTDKGERVRNYHHKTVESLMDILSSTGHNSPDHLNRTQIFRRISQWEVKRYDEIFPLIKRGSLLGEELPEALRLHFLEANADSFMPSSHLADIDKETKNIDA